MALSKQKQIAEVIERTEREMGLKNEDTQLHMQTEGDRAALCAKIHQNGLEIQALASGAYFDIRKIMTGK